MYLLKIDKKDIVYFDGKNTTETTCEESLLFNFLQTLFEKYNNNVSIYIHPKSNKNLKDEKV